jgi:hypothetical protein
MNSYGQLLAATRKPPLGSDLMTYDHPRWPEFADRILSATRCNGDLRRTRRILRDMGMERDWLDATTEWLHQHGGFCDCEVGLNVVLIKEVDRGPGHETNQPRRARRS